ncbi:hypothetical protein MHU86_7150 [Fragilaria crotonensis]|nr:hypothetical protein MHU86_7150 [Fragilaria crotonensis]
MSDPPLPSSSTQSRKKSRVSGTNVSKKLLMELQAVIAFACYDSPSITGAGVSMTEATMEQVMTKLCFGNNCSDEDDTICYVDQFLHGLNRFQGLFASSASPTSSAAPLDKPAVGASSIGGDTELSIPPMLHRQGKMHILWKGSIERVLSRKAPANETPISGRTLLRLAKEVLCNCKKLQAIVLQTTRRTRMASLDHQGQIGRTTSNGVIKPCTKQSQMK